MSDDASADDVLRHLRDRERVLAGIVQAQEDWPDMLSTISEATDADEAHEALQVRFGLDREQALAVLSVQFKRVSRFERQRVRDELEEVRRLLST